VAWRVLGWQPERLSVKVFGLTCIKNALTMPRTAAIIRPSPICGAGAQNAVSDSEVHAATVSAAPLRPKFSVLDVKVLPIRKDGSMAESMF
jgi:hypothetical protein